MKNAVIAVRHQLTGVYVLFQHVRWTSMDSHLDKREIQTAVALAWH